MRILRIFFVLSGIFFLVVILLAFTTLPFWGIHWLGTSKAEIKWEPETIILLGGGGMPSESNLMRSWFAGKSALSFPEASLVIAMPGDITDSLSTPLLMKKELVLRGVNPQHILFEHEGTNTRAQALNCQKILNKSKSILLVTSPDHTRRAVLCFQKVGFEKVNALPAFENATEADLTFRDDELGGRKTAAPDVGQSIQMRYQVWNHLKYEITFAREMLALGYYKLRAWI
ncbi:MAG: YdcF family protein [Mariniphaga sp.]|nr:YdcF family protein [Mariniphaga sp.]